MIRDYRFQLEQLRLLHIAVHPAAASLVVASKVVAEEQGERRSIRIENFEDPHVRLVDGKIRSFLESQPVELVRCVEHPVVEHTIETVTQAAPAAVVTAPAPSNQDLVTAAIGAGASRLVAVYDGGTGTSTPAISVGTYLPKARAVVTAAEDALPKEVLVGFSDGSYAPASLSREGQGLAIYGFGDSATLPKAAAPTLVAAGDLKLGETALAVAADGSASTGIVARVNDTGVHTTLPDIGAGAAAVDLSGNIIGIAVGGMAGLLIPADTISALLTATTTAAGGTPSSASS